MSSSKSRDETGTSDSDGSPRVEQPVEKKRRVEAPTHQEEQVTKYDPTSVEAMTRALQEMNRQLASLQSMSESMKDDPANYVKITELIVKFTKEIAKLRTQIMEQERRIAEANSAAQKATVPTVAAPQAPPLPTYGDAKVGVTPAGAPLVEAFAVTNGLFRLKDPSEDASSGELRPNLFVRNTLYPGVYAAVKPASDGCSLVTMVLGQPGIGKTIGLGNYAAIRFLQEYPDGILITAEDGKTFRIFEPSGAMRSGRFFSDFDSAVAAVRAMPSGDSRPVLFLHDISSGKGGASFPFQLELTTAILDHFERASVVILCSPQPSNYGVAQKMESRQFLSLPTWTMEEVREAGRLGLAEALLRGARKQTIQALLDDSATSLEDGFHLRGGVIRSFLHVDSDVKKEMVAAVAVFDFEKMKSLELMSECSSALVALVPDREFERFDAVVPVSDVARSCLARKSCLQLHNHYKSLMLNSRNGRMVGEYLEQWTLMVLLSLTSTSPLRHCVSLPLQALQGNEKDTLTYSAVQFAESRRFCGASIGDLGREIDTFVASGGGDAVVLEPSNPNFPLVDACVLHKVRPKTRGTSSCTWHCNLFQCTKAKSHAFKTKGAGDVLKLFPRGTHTITVGIGAMGRGNAAAAQTVNIVLKRIIFVGYGDESGFVGVDAVQETKKTKKTRGKAIFPERQFRLSMSEVMIEEHAGGASVVSATGCPISDDSGAA